MKISRIILLLMALGLLASIPAFALPLETTHIYSDDMLNAQLVNQSFVAQGQIGGYTTYELGLGKCVATPAQRAEFNWPNDKDVCFTLKYDSVKNLVTYTVTYGYQCMTLSYYPESIPNDIFIRTFAKELYTGIKVDYLALNGIPIYDCSEAMNPPYCEDILKISYPNLSRGFVLTGKSKMCWTPGYKPKGYDLSYQIIVGGTENEAQCFLPVTLTVAGWVRACQGTQFYPNVYTGFPIAFKNFTFFGKQFPNQLVVGGKYTLAYTGKTSCINNLCRFLSLNLYNTCGPLHQNYECQAYLNNYDNTALAQEVLALALNIAFNDARLMPRSKGFDLEKFTLTRGVFRGKTVGQVLNIANAVLGGAELSQFGLPTPSQGTPEDGCAQLLDVLRQINGNYAFVNINTFTDKTYLRAPYALGLAAPPHQFYEPVN